MEAVQIHHPPRAVSVFELYPRLRGGTRTQKIHSSHETGVVHRLGLQWNHPLHSIPVPLTGRGSKPINQPLPPLQIHLHLYHRHLLGILQMRSVDVGSRMLPSLVFLLDRFQSHLLDLNCWHRRLFQGLCWLLHEIQAVTLLSFRPCESVLAPP